ncbi:hypothetical protein NDU88_005901 [Pleurodeles waltl]|uniref:Uncharacterized protein n=1 Tax=Pleurodeles waltl TaxID=8319 RepID=A0AAV7SN13_PLEWA|nr:hypothetical protein NDU88_005901 [Pleurodeles waltl]
MAAETETCIEHDNTPAVLADIIMMTDERNVSADRMERACLDQRMGSDAGRAEQWRQQTKSNPEEKTEGGRQAEIGNGVLTSRGTAYLVKTMAGKWTRSPNPGVVCERLLSSLPVGIPGTLWGWEGQTEDHILYLPLPGHLRDARQRLRDPLLERNHHSDWKWHHHGLQLLVSLLYHTLEDYWEPQ